MMQMHIGRRVIPVQSFEDASKKFEAARGSRGSRNMPDGLVYDDKGEQVARVSYNARVWAPGPWRADAEPLYDTPTLPTLKSELPVPTFQRRQRVLYRRSIICGRRPEFGYVVKRQPAGSMPDDDWYHVSDDGKAGHGISEHASMITDASDGEGWRERERERLLAEADEMDRFSNQNPMYRERAERVRELAEKL